MDKNKFDEIIRKRFKFISRNARRGDMDLAPDKVPKLIHVPRTCDDCGDLVIGLEQKIYINRPGERNAQWKKKCYSCNKTVVIKGPNIKSDKYFCGTEDSDVPEKTS